MHQWLQSEGAFQLLKENFQMCDVTRQRVIDVLDYDKDKPDEHFTDRALVYVDSSVVGCPKHFGMKKEVDKWVLIDPIEHHG